MIPDSSLAEAVAVEGTQIAILLVVAMHEGGLVVPVMSASMLVMLVKMLVIGVRKGVYLRKGGGWWVERGGGRGVRVLKACFNDSQLTKFENLT